MRSVPEKIMQQQADLSKWMLTRRKATAENIQTLEILWFPIFKYYMHRFGTMGYWHDWIMTNKPMTWKELAYDIHYCCDRMNFGRLVRISVAIERLEKGDKNGNN